MKLFQMFALGTVMATGLVMAQVPKTPSTATGAAKTVKDKVAAPAPPTDAEIAAAKTAGKVWCNTSSKACHAADDKYYGKTKRGEFVMPADVAGKGYHMVAAEGTKGKKAAATTPKQ